MTWCLYVLVNQRQNNPAEQRANNGWGAGSQTYEEYHQGPHQHNGWGNNKQRGRRQQYPLGSGGNELPLGRESRMKSTLPEGAGSSGVPKSAQQWEPQPTAFTVVSAPAQPTLEMPQEDLKREQYKSATSDVAMTEQKAASKAVRAEKRDRARQRKIAKKTAKREVITDEAAAKASKVLQTTRVSIYFVCSREFRHHLCLLRLRKPRNRQIHQEMLLMPHQG
jgi:hypothetical protein